MDRPIGLFDSGVGGLTVMKALSDLLPAENMIYLADQVHFPFGEKDPCECIEYSLECAEFLASQNVKLIVIACHTASALALGKIQKEFSIPVVGVINPRIDLNQYKRLAILGTKNTIHSKVYESIFSNEIFPLACPEFVTLIEKGLYDEEETYQIAKQVLKPLIGKIDAALLACTHFPLMKKTLQSVLGVELIDPGISCAQKAYKLLKEESLLNSSIEYPSYQFITTGSLEIFERFFQNFWNEKVGKKQEIMKLFLKTSSFSTR